MPYVVTPEEWSYLAGIIDGEGYVGLVRHKDYRVDRGGAITYRPSIAVTMTHLKTVEYLAEKLGGHIYAHKVYRKNHKPLHRWFAGTNLANIREIASGLLSYSITKRKQLEKLIQYCDRRIGMERAYAGHKTVSESDTLLWQELKDLNKRGVQSLI